ncbi:hypothetical protein [Pseudomonas fulva]|uniref:hypothetical protein n=1 Tax=Pseudomonas fulva TaxID=47880 RepID=UPI000D8673D1|nr:hypothetical protein [Pseudomonas fulva]PYB87168.1 hypothetical protein DMX01_17840 [Pseudomonas fulva]PYC10969.1 hypothetical protein DMX00_18610 [Pseudomonas fulva]
MILEYVNAFAAGGIALWASWAVLSGKVRDGVLGKILYSIIALSGYAILARSDRMFFTPNTAGVTMHVALALAGIRHMFVVTYWPRVKRWICRRLDCDLCKRSS